jgi:hypothetical protein
LAVDTRPVELFKPIIYVPREPKEDLLSEVLIEPADEYSILWYRWPHDDYTGKEDYEPVVLFHPQAMLEAIGIRPHEKYKVAKRWLSEGVRPIVVFVTAWHGPIIYQGRAGDALTGAFMHPSISIRMDAYDTRVGRPPEWYVKDGTEISVYDFAAEISSGL